MREVVLDEDKENLVCLENQSKIEGHIFRTVIEVEKPGSILIGRDEIDLE